jgi:hypothetical protein
MILRLDPDNNAPAALNHVRKLACQAETVARRPCTAPMELCAEGALA